MPSAGTMTVPIGPNFTPIFNAKTDEGACTKFTVGCPPINANLAVEINIPGLHKEGEGFPIRPGGEKDFENYQDGIVQVFARGVGGSSTIDFGVSGRE